MTILDDLAKSINKSIQDYERANPRSISLERAKEIADAKAEVDSNHTALTLRHALIQQFPPMSGARLSLPIALDWNGLRRRLRQVLDDKRLLHFFAC